VWGSDAAPGERRWSPASWQQIPLVSQEPIETIPLRAWGCVVWRGRPIPSKTRTHAMKTVPRVGRLLDGAGLLLFLGGLALFVRSWLGFRGMPDYQVPADAAAWAAISVADGFWRLQKIGVGFMLAGVAVFVLAWLVARRVTRLSGGTR